jgi:hypothetical protein
MWTVILFSILGIVAIALIALVVRWAAGPDRPEDDDATAGGVGVYGLTRGPDDPA